MTNKQHAYFKKIAQIWLGRRGGYMAVYPEIYAGYNCGRLDVVGAQETFGMVKTFGIEVKVSRADYFGRKQKFLDARSKLMAKEKDLGVNFKYFFTPPNLINVSELYEGWGLIEFDGKRCKVKVEAPKKKVNNGIVMFYMARAGFELYHETKTKLRGGFKWLNYKDLKGEND